MYAVNDIIKRDLVSKEIQRGLKNKTKTLTSIAKPLKTHGIKGENILVGKSLTNGSAAIYGEGERVRYNELVDGEISVPIQKVRSSYKFSYEQAKDAKYFDDLQAEAIKESISDLEVGIENLILVPLFANAPAERTYSTAKTEFDVDLVVDGMYAMHEALDINDLVLFATREMTYKLRKNPDFMVKVGTEIKGIGTIYGVEVREFNPGNKAFAEKFGGVLVTKDVVALWENSDNILVELDQDMETQEYMVHSTLFAAGAILNAEKYLAFKFGQTSEGLPSANNDDDDDSEG